MLDNTDNVEILELEFTYPIMRRFLDFLWIENNIKKQKNCKKSIVERNNFDTTIMTNAS